MQAAAMTHARVSHCTQTCLRVDVQTAALEQKMASPWARVVATAGYTAGPGRDVLGEFQFAIRAHAESAPPPRSPHKAGQAAGAPRLSRENPARVLRGLRQPAPGAHRR